LRRHKYGLYAKMFLEKGITGGMLAEIRKKDLKELIASCMKDSFMHSVIAADTDAIYALIRNQKKTALPKISSSSISLPLQRISSSSSNPMLSSGEGTESDDFDRERSESDLDKQKRGGSWRSSDSHSTDSADSWKKELALSPAFNGRKSEEQPLSPRRNTQTQSSDTVAIKYAFEDREAVVMLVPLWATLAEFKQRIAFACGAPGWDFDMTWRVRMKNDEGHESGSYDVPATTARSTSGESLRRNNPAPALEEKKVAIIETETEWKNLLANAKGTILMYCSKPVPIQKVQQELEDTPGIP